MCEFNRKKKQVKKEVYVCVYMCVNIDKKNNIFRYKIKRTCICLFLCLFPFKQFLQCITCCLQWTCRKNTLDTLSHGRTSNNIPKSYFFFYFGLIQIPFRSFPSFFFFVSQSPNCITNKKEKYQY